MAESPVTEERKPAPRSFGRWRTKDADGVLTATDTVGERRAEMAVRAVGTEAERDAAVTMWRERSVVSHPAIRAVLDAGAAQAEGEGAESYVALEQIEPPSQTLDAWLAGSPDRTARARVASELLGAASVLTHHHLRLPDAKAVVDGYGQPKLLGLEDATAGASQLDERILKLAARVLPEHASRMENATTADVEAVARDIAKDAKGPPTSFAGDAARGEEALSGVARSRQMQIAGIVIAIALAVIVVLALLAR